MVVGYTRYVELIGDLIAGKKVVSTGMRKEIERCKEALALAMEGKTVALVSSGDPGVYGMAGLAIQLASDSGFGGCIEIIPGVTAASSVAARLGAPLMLDFACISLSDLLVPWETVTRRLAAVAEADLVVALYNPRSKKRIKHLDEAAAIFRRHREAGTPVGIVTAAGTDGERVVLSDLGSFLNEDINMRSTVIIGNSTTIGVGEWIVTPRGYET